MSRPILLLFALFVWAAGVFGQKSMPVVGQDSAPVPIARSEPQYSEAARAAGLVGSIFLSMVVDESGRPTEIKVVRWRLREKGSDGEVKDPLGLDEEAVKALKQWRFRPAMKQGKPVPAQANIEINFRL